MHVLRRPKPRLALWALLLVVAAVAAGVAGFDWWLIVLVEFAAWALATIVERAIWDRTSSPPVAPEAEPPAAPPDHETVRWNVSALERLAREHPESEHLRFLIIWLRQFADAAGELPADFDSLVRESFGDLIVG